MKEDQHDDAQGSGKQMISRVAAILRALEGNSGGVSLSRIANGTGLPRSTVQRIVAALEAEKLLSVAPGGSGIRIGAGLVRLAAAAHRDILSIARPYVEALGELLNESVQLAANTGDGNTIVVLQHVPDQILRVVLPTGYSMPIHSTAHGKAMLAAMDDADVERLVGPRLQPQTAKTVESLPKLLEQIQKTREDGYCIECDEQVEGVCALAMAIRSGWGEIYGIVIPTPTARFRGREDVLLGHLAETRALIEARAGGES